MADPICSLNTWCIRTDQHEGPCVDRNGSGPLGAAGKARAVPTDEDVRRVVNGVPPSAYVDNPIIDLVVDTLKWFGGRGIARWQAEAFLPHWQHYRELSAREIASVLARFPQPHPIPRLSGESASRRPRT